MKAREDVPQEISHQPELPPLEIPKLAHYLLLIDHTQVGFDGDFIEQQYWLLLFKSVDN